MLPASPARLIGILGVTAVQLYSCSHVACGGSGVAVGRMAESDGAVRPERVDECIYCTALYTLQPTAVYRSRPDIAHADCGVQTCVLCVLSKTAAKPLFHVCGYGNDTYQNADSTRQPHPHRHSRTMINVYTC